MPDDRTEVRSSDVYTLTQAPDEEPWPCPVCGDTETHELVDDATDQSITICNTCGSDQ